MRLVRFSSLMLLILIQRPTLPGEDVSWIWITDNPADESAASAETPEADDSSVARPASFQPVPPPTIPFARPAETPAPAAARELSESLFGGSLVGRSLMARDRRTYPAGIASDVVSGAEASGRGTTDTGNLLGNSPFAGGSAIQHRNPIVTDTRIRSGRIGRQPGSGSYWVPARIDLDTTLSKIDSRLLSDVVTINGPYAACYGPGFSHIDFQVRDSPRYEAGRHLHGSTSFDYKTNGQPWYGRQSVWGGASDWGFRAGYGHRTGNDYTTGSGSEIPASYNSRDVDLALGKDFSGDSRIEFHGLRLDQTNVELPGQAFDLDWLGTDGYEVEYVLEDQPYFDRLDVNVWYNRTRLDGSAQRPGKRRQFPFYEFLEFVGSTDVDSVSTGYSVAAVWGDADGVQLRAGTDLRYLKQELNEITSGEFAFGGWNDANSPIPESDLVNPGLFADCRWAMGERWKLTAGGRVDYAGAAVLADPARLTALGPAQRSLADILGTEQFDQDFFLWAAYLTAEYEISPCWSAEAAAGYAERPPSLTELYAAAPFMFVLQNGLNTVTGDPRLDRERLCQVDLGLTYDNGYTRGRIGGFHAWAWDYITFENTGTVPGPTNHIEQVQLRYVNTALATFTGAEAKGECDVTDWLTPFATLSYVEGRDQTRNGDFATKSATSWSPATRVYGKPRGYFSNIAPGAAEEPLPGIYPLVSRAGVRLHPRGEASRWSIELAARMVARQDRVATSLLESPTPGFTIWDLRGYWRPTDAVLLIAGIENFTDRQYREHLDFRSPSGIQVFQPGVNFYTGCEVSY